MADTEAGSGGGDKAKTTEAGGRVDTAFIKKPSGYLMLINMILALVSFCLISAWLNDTRLRSGQCNFFTYACTHSWIALLIMLILRLLKVPSYCEMLNWNLAYFINTLIFVIILLIGSCMVAERTAKYYDVCDWSNCHLLGVCAFFGFATTIGCAVECFIHFKEYQGE